MISKRLALVCILLSVFFIAGPASLGFLYKKWRLENKKRDPAFIIEGIVHISKGNFSLPTQFFQNQLNLSNENLFCFNCPKTVDNSIIEWAQVKKIYPNLLYIEYKPREPYARVVDLKEGLVDDRGVLFPKNNWNNVTNLCEVRLGLETVAWGDVVDKKKFILAKEIMSEILCSRIDVSKAFLQNLGQREIVLQLDRNILLRLNPSNWREGVERWFLLREQPLKDNMIVDLRLEDIGVLNG